MSIVDSIVDFFKEFERESPSNVIPFLKKNTYRLIYKGYGTPENEMKFLHDVFLHLNKKYPQFKEFSWEQYVSYNDNYDYFMIEDVQINGYIDVDSGMSFTWDMYSETELDPYVHFWVYKDDRDEIEFSEKFNIDSEQIYKENNLSLFYDYVTNKYKHLDKPTTKYILFLKLLETQFSMYYFLYTFGNAIKVVINKNEIQIIKREYNKHNELGFKTD